MPEVKVKVVEIDRKKYTYTMDRKIDELREAFHCYRLERQWQSDAKSKRITELEEGLKALKQQLVAYYARCGGEHGPSGSHLKNSVDSMKQAIDDLLQGD